MSTVQICMNYLRKWGLPMSCNVSQTPFFNTFVVILFLILLIHSDSNLIEVGIGRSPRVVITLPFRSSVSLSLLKCYIISVLIQDWMGKKEVLKTVATWALSYNLQKYISKYHFKSRSLPFFIIHICALYPLIFFDITYNTGGHTFPPNSGRPYGSWSQLI